MTEEKATELLALDPAQESEFKDKVKEVKKKKKKRPTKTKGKAFTPGVLYLGHLPVGLFEPQLKAYFEQFGKVEKLRLSRSKKTGGSKGYGFIQFECEEVAEIVAETMNNYLMGERLIQCHLIPKEKVHERMFVGAVRPFRKPTKKSVLIYNNVRSEEQVSKMTSKLLGKERTLRKKLLAKGIEYDFPGFSAQPRPKKSSDVLNASTCSDDVTPACTPSLLARRKSTAADNNTDDDEVIIKMPPVEDLASSSAEEDNEDHLEESKDNMEEE